MLIRSKDASNIIDGQQLNVLMILAVFGAWKVQKKKEFYGQLASYAKIALYSVMILNVSCSRDSNWFLTFIWSLVGLALFFMVDMVTWQGHDKGLEQGW